MKVLHLVTDDFKIITNRAIIAVKEVNKKDFETALNYIFANLEVREIKPYIEYLWNKLQEQTNENGR